MTGARTARVSVEHAVTRFIATTEHDRLVLYRMHLQATVRSVSPFLLAFADHVGVDLQERMHSMRPPAEWPWRPQLPTSGQSPAHRALASRYYLDPRVRAAHGLLQRYVTNNGAVHIGEGEDMLLFDVDGPWLSMQGRTSGCAIRVVKGMVALTLPVGFPETLALAMVGRPVDAAISNPALSGKGYRVRWVREARAGAGPTFVFPTGRKRFSMPWPDLLPPVYEGAVSGAGARPRHAPSRRSSGLAAGPVPSPLPGAGA